MDVVRAGNAAEGGTPDPAARRHPARLPLADIDLADVDATFCGAVANTVLDAWLGHDRDWLLEAERDLQDLLVLAPGPGTPADGTGTVAKPVGRTEAVLELVRGALRRLAAEDATAAVTPGSVAHLMLRELAASDGLTNRALASALLVDETQISRAGRKLEDVALAWKRRLGRTNLWELTPRGRQAVTTLGSTHVQPQPRSRNRDADIFRVVQRAFASVTETPPEHKILSGSTLTSQVASALDLSKALAEDGVRLLAESPLVERSRKALLLRRDQPCAVGISAEANTLVGVLVNASAEALGDPLRHPLTSHSPSMVARNIASLTRQLLDPHGSVEPLGLGVELPGHIDGWRGVVRLSHEFQDGRKPWQDVDLGVLLQEATGLSAVVVENDANAVALYECHFGFGRKHRDFSTVLLTERGLGAGIVLRGTLLRGEGVAGEIGHMPLGDPATCCRCGRQGCLETELINLLNSVANAQDARQATRLASAAGELLGAGIAVLLNLLGSEHVVIIGSGAVFAEESEACKSFRSGTRKAVGDCGFSSAAFVDPHWRYGSREHRARGAAAALIGRYRPSSLPEPEAASDLLQALRRWGTPMGAAG